MSQYKITICPSIIILCNSAALKAINQQSQWKSPHFFLHNNPDRQSVQDSRDYQLEPETKFFEAELLTLLMCT